MPAYKEVTGLKFGKLLVLKEIKIRDKNGVARYKLECQCECGKVTTPEKSKVLLGKTKSCGCLQENMRKHVFDAAALPVGQAAFNEVYGSYKNSARRRGIEFNLTKDEFRQIIVGPCIYCGDILTNKMRGKGGRGEFLYTGIDRYDNDKGYIFSNCVSCCKVCNRIKTNLNVEEMEEKLETILSRKTVWKRIA